MDMTAKELSENRAELIAIYRKERAGTDADFRPVKNTKAKELIEHLDLPKKEETPFKRRF
jgi:hypothetical protein